MRFLSIPVLFLLTAAVANAQPTGKELIESFRQSIGMDKSLPPTPYLIKYRGERFMYSLGDGRLQGQAFDLDATLMGYTDKPQKHRKVLEMKIGIVPFRITEVVDGDTGWYQINDGDPVVMTKTLIQGRRQREIHVEVFLGLEAFPPNDWNFTTPKSGRYHGQDVWEFDATTKGLDPITLSFGKKSGFLLRLKTKATDFALLPGAEAKVESFTRDLQFFSWRKVDGRVLPGQLEAYHDGVLWKKLEPVSVSFPKTVDAKLFEMPSVQK